MNAGDKQIKFTFAVDQRSLQAAKQAIASLTSEVKTLVETMQRAGSAMGTIGGGHGLLGGVSGKSGGINPSQQAGLRGGSILTQGIAGDARALAGLAKASNEALSSITRSMRSNFSGQVSEIERLKRELGTLEQRYERMQKLAGSALPGSKTASGVQSLMIGNEIARSSIQAQISGHLEARNAAMAAQNAPFEEPAPGKPGKPSPGFFAQLKAFGSQSGVGQTANAFSSAAGLGGVGSLLGLGGVGAAGVAAIMFMNRSVAAMNQQETTQARYNLDIGMRDGRMGARIGSSIGALGLGIRGGDLASSLAFEKLALTGKFAERGIGLGVSRDELMREEAGMGPTLGAAGGRFMNRAGAGLSKLMGSPLGNVRTAHALAYENLRASISAQQAEEAAEMVRNEVASNPQAAMMYNAAYGNAFGNIGLARTAGIGLGLNKAGTNTRIADFNARALAAGYDPGAVASARAALGGVAGRGLMGAGQQMLGLQMGGFGNAGLLYGVGAQFGGGGARGAQAMINAIQRSGIGGGGVDITAGSQIAGIVAQAMTSGNFVGSDGIAGMQGMMSAGATGTPGGDMRMARVLGAGMAEFARNAGGTTDRLQLGINTLAANASGVRGLYGRHALMNMDPMQMIDALRSGKLPSTLAGQGVSMENLQRYVSFRNSYAFSRYIDQEGTGTAQGAAVAGVKAAGGLGNYMHSLGLTGNSKKGRELIQLLATARQATEGGTLEGNEGALYAEIAGDKSLLPTLRSRGAGGPKLKGTIEESAAQQAARQAKEQGEFETTRYDYIRKSISTMTDNSNALANLTADLVGGTKMFDTAVKALTESIMDSLHRMAPDKWAAIEQARRDAEKGLSKSKAKAIADIADHAFGGKAPDTSNMHKFGY